MLSDKRGAGISEPPSRWLLVVIYIMGPSFLSICDLAQEVLLIAVVFFLLKCAQRRGFDPHFSVCLGECYLKSRLSIPHKLARLSLGDVL